jgi:hypothetical protein
MKDSPCPMARLRPRGHAAGLPGRQGRRPHPGRYVAVRTGAHGIRDDIKSQRARDRNTLFETGVREDLRKQGKIKYHQDVIDRRGAEPGQLSACCANCWICTGRSPTRSG